MEFQLFLQPDLNFFKKQKTREKEGFSIFVPTNRPIIIMSGTVRLACGPRVIEFDWRPHLVIIQLLSVVHTRIVFTVSMQHSRPNCSSFVRQPLTVEYSLWHESYMTAWVFVLSKWSVISIITYYQVLPNRIQTDLKIKWIRATWLM